jgi:hypothetical protein
MLLRFVQVDQNLGGYQFLCNLISCKCHTGVFQGTINVFFHDLEVLSSKI